MSEDDVLKALSNAFEIPGGVKITTEAMHAVIGDRKNDKPWIKLHFSELVEEIQLRAYDIYLKAERPAAAKAFREVFSKLLPENPTSDDFYQLLEKNFMALDRFFLSLTQGRRPRAGKAFEHVINVLFSALEYPYTSQPVINGQPDFLLPGIEHYKRNPMDCIIFTVKRSLRERWRQIVTEGTRGHMFFLATIDENVGERDLAEMLRNRIYLVMPDRIRASKYPELPNVISFENFFAHYLDPAMTRWKANRVIT